LRNGRSAGQVAKSLRARIKRHALNASAAKPVTRAARYLVNNSQLLHYDRALAEGLPIATGVIEGACRYLVQDRMGRTGARWSATGAEATSAHQSRYTDNVVPNPLPPRRPRLRLVKRSFLLPSSPGMKKEPHPKPMS